MLKTRLGYYKLYCIFVNTCKVWVFVPFLHGFGGWPLNPLASGFECVLAFVQILVLNKKPSLHLQSKNPKSIYFILSMIFGQYYQVQLIVTLVSTHSRNMGPFVNLDCSQRKGLYDPTSSLVTTEI